MPSKKSPSKKTRKSPRKSPRKKSKSPKRGGSLNSDLQALAVPFALTVLQRGVAGHVKKAKGRKSVSGGDGAAVDAPPMLDAPLAVEAPMAGGAKRKQSKAKATQIKKEFMDITDRISSFLKKY
jgi:hypothetical protein